MENENVYSEILIKQMVALFICHRKKLEESPLLDIFWIKQLLLIENRHDVNTDYF